VGSRETSSLPRDVGHVQLLGCPMGPSAQGIWEPTGPAWLHGPCNPLSDYERFNSSNDSIRTRSWNYTTAGTRLALQWLLITVFGLHPLQAVPTNEVMHGCCSSLLPQWVFVHGAICVPAARRSSGSRL